MEIAKKSWNKKAKKRWNKKQMKFLNKPASWFLKPTHSIIRNQQACKLQNHGTDALNYTKSISLYQNAETDTYIIRNQQPCRASESRN